MKKKLFFVACLCFVFAIPNGHSSVGSKDNSTGFGLTKSFTLPSETGESYFSSETDNDFDFNAPKKRKKSKSKSSSRGKKSAGNPFKLDFSMGLAIGDMMGFVFAVEPKYEVIERLTIGLRWEEGFMFKYSDNTKTIEADPSDPYSYPTQVGTTEMGMIVMTSFMPTAEYTFMDGSFRPFAGVGVGVHFIAGGSMSMDISEDGTTEDQMDAGMRFGFTPRIGFEYKRFRLALEYNYIVTDVLDANYFAVKLGIFAWGNP